MTLSVPPPAPFDLIGSFARRRGSDIEIVLSQPELELPSSGVSMTLSRGHDTVEASGRTEDGAGGQRLVVRLPRAELADGTWKLSVERADGPPERIAARLLVQGERPVVLLWGANDPASVVPSPRRTLPPRRRAARAAGRALDRALTVLPEERARSVRSRARSVARRVVG